MNYVICAVLMMALVLAVLNAVRADNPAVSATVAVAAR